MAEKPSSNSAPGHSHSPLLTRASETWAQLCTARGEEGEGAAPSFSRISAATSPSSLCRASSCSSGSDSGDEDYVEDEEARQQRLHLAYCEEGTQRALRLKNRGPMRLGPDKKLHPDILGARPASYE